ncbi:unnamed protein product [Notodromas monacha]|uniref:t-SNARE coiled-coil homology domain-containing protein n=1 Tax=Notodromas monacha TaxID=399045 RepID=A0A7R9GEL1_9CRUS|nr:unnamed protein product [Notodromas monacha]CAG0918382.1 unnamed protein product [Notodromas monacha]
MASGNRYLEDKSNPFFGATDDVDDDAFLKRRGNSSSYMFSDHLTEEERKLDERRQELLAKRREVENRTIESTMRSVALIDDSERVGTETASNLLVQREKLEKTEERLDVMNDNLRQSERHITSIKSVFGSIKNYFSKQPVKAKPVEKSKTDDNLSSVVSPPKENGDHPALSLRGVDYGGSGGASSRAAASSKPQSADEIIDKNLEDMSLGLARLKGLASGLGNEIESQNQLLDRITDKAEKNEWKVQRQNKEMARILKK